MAERFLPRRAAGQPRSGLTGRAASLSERATGEFMDERKAAVEILQLARKHLKEHVDECGLWQAIHHALPSGGFGSATDKALSIAIKATDQAVIEWSGQTPEAVRHLPTGRALFEAAQREGHDLFDDAIKARGALVFSGRAAKRNEAAPRRRAALVGWYLMLPPLRANDHGEITSLSSYAPLSQWDVSESYDSAAECRAGRAKRVRTMKEGPCVFTEGPCDPSGRCHGKEKPCPQSEKKLLALQAEFGQCIATDDPRLKQK